MHLFLSRYIQLGMPASQKTQHHHGKYAQTSTTLVLALNANVYFTYLNFWKPAIPFFYSFSLITFFLLAIHIAPRLQYNVLIAPAAASCKSASETL